MLKTATRGRSQINLFVTYTIFTISHINKVNVTKGFWFCISFYFYYKAEYLIEKESKKTDEKGRVRAGI